MSSPLKGLLWSPPEKTTFKKPSLIRIKRCFSLIKALSWFHADLKILLTPWLKFTLSQISFPESLKCDFSRAIFIIWPVWFHLDLLKIYRMKFTRDHNLVVIFDYFIVVSLSDSKIKCIVVCKNWEMKRLNIK